VAVVGVVVSVVGVVVAVVGVVVAVVGVVVAVTPECCSPYDIAFLLHPGLYVNLL